MSAFCVFGMTEPAARKIATTASETMYCNLPPPRREAFTKEDMAAWIAKRTEEVLEGSRRMQISPAFDAPQFANEWIDLAKRTARAKRCSIMVRGVKVDVHGNPVISKTKKTPLITWVPYLV